MTDRSLKRRAIADKLSADVARLTKEIEDRRRHLNHARGNLIQMRIAKAYLAGVDTPVEQSWFAVWSRHAPAIAKAVAQLDRAKTKLIGAVDKADRAAMLARETRERLTRIKAANVGYMLRLDALAKDAPSIDARWARERVQEERRVRALRKRLAKRTTKDYTARPDWMAKPVKLPEPVQQPSSSIETDAPAPPPRAGLIPGTFTVMDPARISKLIDRPVVPNAWSAAYVGVRFIEAHRVLSRMPGSIGPRSFGKAWPEYVVEAGEAAIQAGAGTFEIGRNTIRIAPGSEAVARCHQALAWPMQFLSHRSDLAGDLNRWADDAAWEQLEFDSRGAPWEALQIIANSLNAAKEPVS